LSLLTIRWRAMSRSNRPRCSLPRPETSSSPKPAKDLWSSLESAPANWSIAVKVNDTGDEEPVIVRRQCTGCISEYADNKAHTKDAPVPDQIEAGAVVYVASYAGGVYALRHHVKRLAEDHANARRLAEGLSEARMPVEVKQVETNFVLVDAGALGLGADDAVARLRAEGVLLSFGARKDVLRAVTHLDVLADDIEQAVERIPRALSGDLRDVDLAAPAPTPY